MTDEIILIIAGSTFFFTFVMMLLFYERNIMAVYDHQGELAFKVQQKGLLLFQVKGFNGYPRKVSFRTYVDVVAYIDKHINGF